MTSVLKKAANEAKNGHTSAALNILQAQIDKGSPTYSIYTNLAALELQRGHVKQAINYNTKAISMDPYCYIAYYNRFLCNLPKEQESAWYDLQKSLSCLYLLKGIQFQDRKLIEKAISHCPKNAKAYLFRAKLNEKSNQQASFQDYSSAIEHDSSIREIYQQRALFSGKKGKIEQLQQDIAKLNLLTESNAKSIQQLADRENNKSTNYESKIKEGITQFFKIFDLKEKAVQPEDQQNQFLKIKPRQQPASQKVASQDEILLQQQPPSDKYQSTRTLLIKQQVQFQKGEEQERMDKNFKQIFQDENSADIDQRINNLQNQIKQEGGKLPQMNDQADLDWSDPLSMEFQKAIKQLQQLGDKDMMEIKSSKSGNSGVSSQFKLQQFNSHSHINLKIDSLIDLDNPNYKQMAKVVLKYGDTLKQTTFKSYDWQESIKIPIYRDRVIVDVRVMLKGSIFTAETLIGQGTINLLQKNNSRFLLGVKQKNTCVLNYWLSLI